MRIGLVGYGTGGKNFHSPYIEAATDCELAGIVARAPATMAQARADWPGTPIFGSLGEMIDSGVDAVTISTPPATRRELVLEAAGRGIMWWPTSRSRRARRPRVSWCGPPRMRGCC